MRWTLCLLVVACSAQGTKEAAPVQLRLGTHIGLARMEPDVAETITVGLVELVYLPLSRYFDDVQVQGNRVRLRVKASTAASAQDLADHLEHRAITSRSVDHGDVLVTLATPDAARALSLDQYLLSMGPYHVKTYDGEQLVLSRKDLHDGPQEIRVTKVTSEDEEWKGFIAGKFDLLPYVLPRSFRYLSQIPTIRIVRFVDPQSAALWFRWNGGKLSDERIREGIALGIRRGPLAASITHDAQDAIQVPQDVDRAQRLLEAAGVSVENPLELRLILPAAQPEFVRAALLLEQQLAVLGVVLRVELLSQNELAYRLQNRDFDLLLFAGNVTPRYWPWLRRASAGNLVGYDSNVFEAAAAANDVAGAKAVLERDLPLTPLFSLNEGVAANREFCNVRPREATDFSWLANVHRCAPGEEN